MLNKMLKDAVTIAIGGHIRPDGDCVGSCIGLYQYIKDNYKDKKADVYLEEIPDSFHFLKPADVIRHEIPADVTYDLFICLDCGDSARLGFSAPLFEEAGETLCVDHHVSNQSFADENYIFPETSSTSELIFELLETERITKEIAECIYVGIVHDTGVFQYSSTSAKTMETAGILMEKGIDFSKIIDDTFYTKTFGQNQILGQALLNSQLFLDGAVIATAISQEEMKQFGVQPKHLDGIVSQLRVTKGVEAAIFLYENEDHTWKVSMRSNGKVDVAAIAMKHQGGGHVRAAGANMGGVPKEVIAVICGEIEGQLHD